MIKNKIQVYLLPVEELFGSRAEPETEGTTRQNPGTDMRPEDLPGWERLTDWQQARVSRCRTHSGAVKLCLGAALLLQYGVHRAAEYPETEALQARKEPVSWQILTGEQLLSGIPGPLPLEVVYGERGKPMMAHVPWHYNLSHSGDYAALALSGVPVGIDIQNKGTYSRAMVQRFFSPEEAAAYEKLSRCAGAPEEAAADLFYTLWCRKEAYGKLKGTGLTEKVLKRNMLEDTEAFFGEYDRVPGYRICVCCEKG